MKRLALLAIAAALALAAPAARADFSEFELEEAGASLSSYQAGAHADFTTYFRVKEELAGGDVAQTRDVTISLPPGLLGNPNVLPRCTVEELREHDCPIASQVGITEVFLASAVEPLTKPVYNMVSPGGDVVARFGFDTTFFPVTFSARVRPDDYGVDVEVENAGAQIALKGARTTIWGVPGDPSHDSERFRESDPPGTPISRPSGLPPEPFLSNPTRCGVPLRLTFAADSYQTAGNFSRREATMPPIVGCSGLSFEPTVSAQPTSPEAAAPTGLDVDIEVPQDEAPSGRATAQMRDVRATLPEGMTIAPGAADGLAACDAAQAAYQEHGPAHCPDAAKIGSVELDVAALEHPLHGGLYQRAPQPGHLFRVWLIADELGVHIALPGEIELDPVTGRVTSTFLETPQAPVREAKLHIFGGPRAPLATPSACGVYQSAWSLTPWSGAPAEQREAAMSFDRGCGTGGFAPRLSAGMTEMRAADFAPFVFDLAREAGEQNVAGLEVALPPGLLAKLKGVPLCQAGTDCPPGSQLGSVAVASGPGTNPLWIPQPGKAPTAIFLAGPYKGAPYSLVIRVPAQAGPFDLGTVAVRAALRVDPESTRVTVASDPLPQILEGVPITYRRIHAEITRPQFTLNPTNCAPKQIAARVSSSAGVVAHPAVPYQVTACARLRYRPKLSLRLRGGTKRTQHPAVTAVLTQPPGQANTASASVILPHSEFLDQSHLSSPCTRVQFAAGQCPAGSILGTATALSPLLGAPLKGKVYFRSNGGERELPDIVVDLEGPIHVTLVGYVDSVHAKGSESSRIRTTFAHIPDAPVTKFTMRLYGGKRGLLQNSAGLCAAPRRVSITLLAQNGKHSARSSQLQTSCGKNHR